MKAEFRAGSVRDSCDICGKKNSDKLTLVISFHTRLDVCNDCMNLYANHKYDELREKLNENKNV